MSTSDDHDETEILGAVDALLDILGRDLGLLTTRSELRLLHRQYAAAALARGCAILRSARSLIDAGHNEGIGLLSRALWETWLVGAFVLAGREEALFRLEGEQQRQVRNLAERNGLHPEVMAKLEDDQRTLTDAERARRRNSTSADDSSDTIAFGRLQLEQIAKELGPLLVEARLEESADITAAYDLLYRSHSAFDAHGIAALERHLDLSAAGVISLHVQPPSWIETHRSLGIGALQLSLLARYIYLTFGIGTWRLDDVQTSLFRHLQAAGISSVEQARAAGLPGDWDSLHLS